MAPQESSASTSLAPSPLTRSPTFLAVVQRATAFDHVTGSPASSSQLSLRLHDVYRRAAASREAIRLEQELRKAETRVELKEMLQLRIARNTNSVIVDEMQLIDD